MPCTASVIPQPSRRTSSLRSGLRSLVRKIGVALVVRAERRALMALDDAALKDIGFNKGLAQGEYGRTFWDVPVDRLRT